MTDFPVMFVAVISLVVNGALCFLLFYRLSIRASQYFSIVALYSFAVRPLATELCDTFQPFYYFEPGLYAHGVILGNLGLFAYNVGLLLTGKPTEVVNRFDYGELSRFSLFALLIAFAIDVAALQIFGTAILPGVRTTGLQQAAAGSQVYFAFVSALTVVGFGTAVACAIIRPAGVGIWNSLLKIIGFAAISMLFYQRGALLLGGVLGLVIAALHDRRFYLANISRTLLIFAGFVSVAAFGRPVIKAVISMVEPQAQVLDEAPVALRQQPACKIANVANQEHDQVWPTVLNFVERYEPDNFANVVAAFLRPFLSAEARDRMGLATSIDSLNLYNDAQTYLNFNFGFSISSSQYLYFSVGNLFIIAIFVCGVLSSLAENAMSKGVRTIDVSSLRRAIVCLNIVYLLASPMDEQLKWAAINIVTGLALISGFERLRAAGLLSPVAGSR